MFDPGVLQAQPHLGPVARVSHTPTLVPGGRPEPGSNFAIWRISGSVNTRVRSTGVPPTSRLLTVSSGLRGTKSRINTMRNICFRAVSRTFAVRSFPSAVTTSGKLIKSACFTASMACSPKRGEHAALQPAGRERLPTFVPDATMAGAVLFLASPLAAYVCGQTLRVDSGLGL